MTQAWHGTGDSFDVDNPWEFNRIPPYDERSGDHYWVIMAAYRVDPTKWTDEHTPYLDRENLAIISGPGCYYCEQPYTQRLAHRRCKGDPQ